MAIFTKHKTVYNITNDKEDREKRHNLTKLDNSTKISNYTNHRPEPYLSHDK